MIVSIADYAICDGSLPGGVALSGMRLLINRSIEVVLPLGEAIPTMFDRQGRTSHFTFQVARTHSSAEACDEFIVTLDSSLPSEGTVTITLDGGTESVELQHGRVLSHQSNQIGATSFTDYVITGGPPLPLVFGSILLETGDFILTETDYKIKLG